MLTIRVPSIKCSRFHSQETEDSIDGNDSPGGGAELCPPDFVFVVMARRIPQKTGGHVSSPIAVSSSLLAEYSIEDRINEAQIPQYS